MSNGRRYRRRQRTESHGSGRRCGGNTPGGSGPLWQPYRPPIPPEGLRSLEEWEDDPTCPECGPIDRLSTGWLTDDEVPEVLCCPGCWTPLVRF